MAAITAEAAPLPGRLMSFFARYPPKLYSAKFTRATDPLSNTTATAQGQGNPSEPSIPIASNTSSGNPNAPVTVAAVSPKPSPPSLPNPNPFLPWMNPETGRWRGAVVSLRQQADLVKLAKKYHVESLLPPGRKSTEFKEQRILEKGLRVKGTGAGQKVKGHKWERRLNATLEKRRKAMEEMSEMIRLWKQVSRFWRFLFNVVRILMQLIAARPWKGLEEISSVACSNAFSLYRYPPCYSMAFTAYIETFSV